MNSDLTTKFYFKKMFKFNIIISLIYILIIMFFMYKTYLFLQVRPEFEKAVWSNILFIDIVMIFHFLYRIIFFYNLNKLEVCEIPLKDIQQIFLIANLNLDLVTRKIALKKSSNNFVLIYDTKPPHMYDYLYFTPSRLKIQKT